MKRSKNIYFTLVILIVTHMTPLIYKSSAQSVETFIEMAKEKNPGLDAIRLSYSAAQMQAEQVDDYPDPTISLGIGVLPIETRLGAQRFRLGVTQAIPWKGLLDARKSMKISEAEVLAFMDDVKAIDIEYSIRRAYSALVFLNDKKAIVESKLEVLDILEELAKSALRSGKGKLSNVLLIQRAREAIQSDLLLIEKQKEPPTIMINRWSGRDLKTNIQTASQLIIPKTQDSYFAYAESGHPQFQILESKIKASEQAIQLTNYESKPKIGVGLEYALIDGRNDVDIPGNGRDVLMPMGSISIPLHTGRFDAKRQEEKIKQESIKATVEDLREMYKAEIVSATSDIEYADMEVQKIEGLKTITDETLKLMRSEYASEGTRFEELLRLEMELIDYDLMIAMAKFNQLLGQAVLKKYE